MNFACHFENEFGHFCNQHVAELTKKYNTLQKDNKIDVMLSKDTLRRLETIKHMPLEEKETNVAVLPDMTFPASEKTHTILQGDLELPRIFFSTSLPNPPGLFASFSSTAYFRLHKAQLKEEKNCIEGIPSIYRIPDETYDEVVKVMIDENFTLLLYMIHHNLKHKKKPCKHPIFCYVTITPRTVQVLSDSIQIDIAYNYGLSLVDIYNR